MKALSVLVFVLALVALGAAHLLVNPVQEVGVEAAITGVAIAILVLLRVRNRKRLAD